MDDSALLQRGSTAHILAAASSGHGRPRPRACVGNRARKRLRPSPGRMLTAEFFSCHFMHSHHIAIAVSRLATQRPPNTLNRSLAIQTADAAAKNDVHLVFDLLPI
jgi:hypothetical protein